MSWFSPACAREARLVAASDPARPSSGGSHGARQAGAAHRWAESTFAAVGRLADFPENGRVVPELRRHEVREAIHGSYRIIYRIDEERVLILTVRHGKQRFDLAEIE